MQVVPSIKSITNGMHLLEMPDDIIINSQMYKKTTFIPTSYNFFNINSDGNLLDKYLYLGTKNRRCHKESTYSNILQDSTNADICYFISPEESAQLFKIERLEENYSQENVVNLDSSACAKFICQTSDYLVLDVLYDKYDSIVRVKKENFEVTKYTTAKSSSAYYIQKYVIKSDENYVYYFEIKRDDTQIISFNINKYNIGGNTVETIYSEDDLSIIVGKSSCATIGNKTFIFGRNNYSFAFIGYQINYSADTVVKSVHNITTPSFSNILNLQLSMTLRSIDDEYMVCTIHQIENESCGTNGNKLHQHLLYKFNNERFTFVDKITLSQGCYGVLYYNDLYHLIFTPNKYEFYKLDLESEKFSKVFEKAGDINFIGIDATKRIYNISQSDKIDIISNATICSLESRFEKDSYEYNGTDIQTKAYIKVKNFQSEYVSVQIDVILRGPCYFTDGTQKMTTNTYEDEELVLDIVIKNSGKIDLVVKQLGVN